MHDISSSNGSNSPSFVGAIDQGTTSSRFIIFDQYARIVASHQLEFPQSAFPMEILKTSDFISLTFFFSYCSLSDPWTSRASTT